MESAHDLIHHLTSPQFSEIALAVAVLKKTAILSPIQGLSTNDVPLWRLATLLMERWMDEDLFNALVEISYFKHQAKISLLPSDTAIPSSLFLPTTFLSDARRHYHRQPQQYTTEINDLRQRLLFTTVKSIYITSVFDDHYTAYVYNIGSTTIDHGDSLHQPPADDILGIISWVISGLGHPPVENICEGTISRQGRVNGGEGSCGIAALNFIECYSDNDLRQWEGSNSSLFCDVALQNLIRYHHCAGDQVEDFFTLVQNVVKSVSPHLTAPETSTVSSLTTSGPHLTAAETSAVPSQLSDFLMEMRNIVRNVSPCLHAAKISSMSSLAS